MPHIDDVQELLRRYVVDTWSQGDVDTLDDLVTDDFRLAGDVTLDEYKGLIRRYRAAIPDLTITIDDVVAEGDKVAYRWTMHGTHEGDFEGMPPTGKAVSSTGITMLRLRDGMVADDRFESSSPSLREQFSEA